MLSRWDPVSEMMSLRNALDRVFDSNQLDTTGRAVTWGLPLDVSETDDHFIVKASIPGINPDDIEITFTDNVLTIKGETKADEEVKDSHYHLRERRYGSFSRSISLSSRIDSDNIHADYQNGVLTLTLPKAAEVKPKRISIMGNGKVIEAKTK
jgi:HSP20 family protein